MKRSFQRLWALMVMVTLCVLGFSSCSLEEEYEFEFELPGQIVSRLGATVQVPFKAVNISSVSVTGIPKGWTVNSVDMVNCVFTITAPDSFASEDNDVEENGLLKISGFTAAGSTHQVSSYLSLLNRSVDLTDQYANSYVISEKDTRYTIDVTHKGESAQRITPAKVDVIWQTDVFVIDYDSYDAEKGTFTFYVGSEDVKDTDGKVIENRIPYGNALVGAYDEDDNIIWSWHLWLTPDIESGVIKTSVGEFMDRNLGAFVNSNGSTDTDDIYNSYGLYYQWGRKEPFVRPLDYKFSSNKDQQVYSGSGAKKLFRYVTAEIVDGEERKYPFGTMEYAIADPFTFLLGTEANAFDWLSGSNDKTMWQNGSKGLYDPCPRGWRVPDGDTFTAFDIDTMEDAAALADVRNMYGWHLVDKATGVKMFMPGAGRRSYENGVLTNVNNYGYENNPMPWIGYYWTASATGNQAQSMFFDLNTTRAVNNRYEAQKAMYRGNGMQIRCVRDK